MSPTNIRGNGKTMYADQKWIRGTQPEQHISQVARCALKQRLDSVWHYLPLAAFEADDDFESVHQLRVSARRVVAAMRVFADVLPERRANKLRHQLQRIRRTAGVARDLDVLQRHLASNPDSATPRVLSAIQRCRRNAQTPLVELHAQLDRKGFSKKGEKLLEQVRWRRKTTEATLAVVARRELRPLVQEFFQCAASDMSDVESLHQLRISGKQVRCALELLAGAFERRHRSELSRHFEQTQDKLGEINDYVTACRLFARWIEKGGDPELIRDLVCLSSTEQQQMQQAIARFQEWWTTDRREGLEQRFNRLLATRSRQRFASSK